MAWSSKLAELGCSKEASSVNWKVVGTSCKLKSCKGVFGVQLARSEDSTVLTTKTSQESCFVHVILFLMFAFRRLRSFATWFGAEWPKSILQAGYFAVTLAKSNMQDVPTIFQFTLECMVTLHSPLL